MASNLVFLFGLVSLIGLTSGSGISVRYLVDIMKNYTTEGLTTLDNIMTIDQQSLEKMDFTSKFECGEELCSLCASFNLQDQKREVCVKEYNRKIKPNGLTAFYVDGKQTQEFTALNHYCERLWGTVLGCLTVYRRSPDNDWLCFNMDINLLFTIIKVDFSCVKHVDERIGWYSSINIPHVAGEGILDVDLFGGRQPVVTINQKDKETVESVRTAIKKLLEKEV